MENGKGGNVRNARSARDLIRIRRRIKLELGRMEFNGNRNVIFLTEINKRAHGAISATNRLKVAKRSRAGVIWTRLRSKLTGTLVPSLAGVR